MRIVLSILLIGQMGACLRNQQGADRLESTSYQPHPVVQLSTVNAGNRIISAYVRHSRGSVLIHMAPAEMQHGFPIGDVKLVLNLHNPGKIEFSSKRYENFDRSIDLYQDGRIVLVPLPDNDGGLAAGAFVNLISGDRYFFAPSVRSPESLAKIRWLTKDGPAVTVIFPEDTRAHERLAQYPDFKT